MAIETTRVDERASKPRVVYIMGTGRSGSTVLGITLGNLEGAFFIGEAFSWCHFAGAPTSQEPETLALWERVRAKIPRAREFFATDFFRRLEHHSSLLRPWRRSDAALRTLYRDCTTQLFRAVRDETGADILVDSSHFPLRGSLLLDNPDLEIFLLYLVRDPIDVINALQADVQRNSPMKPWIANLYTLWVWALSEWVFRRAPPGRRMKLRYEDFVADPARHLSALCAALGTPNTIERFDALRTGRVFQGNRVRTNKVIALTSPEKKNLLARHWLWLSRLIQYPMRRAYRY